MRLVSHDSRESVTSIKSFASLSKMGRELFDR